MTANRDTPIETDKPKSFRSKVTDDVNTESYHTSGKIRFSYSSVWNASIHL